MWGERRGIEWPSPEQGLESTPSESPFTPTANGSATPRSETELRTTGKSDFITLGSLPYPPPSTFLHRLKGRDAVHRASRKKWNGNNGELKKDVGRGGETVNFPVFSHRRGHEEPWQMLLSTAGPRSQGLSLQTARHLPALGLAFSSSRSLSCSL